MVLYSGNAYVINSHLGLCVFDVTPPENTSLIYNLGFFGEPQGIDIEDDYCFITCSNGMLFIVDLSDPNEPFIVSDTDYPYNLRGIDVYGDYAYICCGGDGILDRFYPIGEEDEECDDGNTNSGDGCSSQCRIEILEGESCSSDPDSCAQGLVCGSNWFWVSECHLGVMVLGFCPFGVDTYRMFHLPNPGCWEPGPNVTPIGTN